MKSYSLLDSGNGRKLEQFGPYVLDRPSPLALWRPSVGKWKSDAAFHRETGWSGSLPREWEVEIGGIRMQIRPTDFGHLGLFPEHATLWAKLDAPRLLNLFAYSGGATVFAAKRGAEVCHVDASKGMIEWAQENAQRNGLGKAPIRWIVDDVIKFLTREVRRGRRYEGIILDPPSFGRGSRGEVFKVDDEMGPLLDLCQQLLSDKASFVILSCHTPGYTPLVLQHLLQERFGDNVTGGEMALPGKRPVPNGAYAEWRR
ncbi:MAG: class I SAM-dependent methyltransferase [Verrucomicrobia bacterium]|nr:class I SAM-dependent methyltransferase [Verrucomicrobiota bacterium]